MRIIFFFSPRLKIFIKKLKIYYELHRVRRGLAPSPPRVQRCVGTHLGAGSKGVRNPRRWFGARSPGKFYKPKNKHFCKKKYFFFLGFYLKVRKVTKTIIKSNKKIRKSKEK